MPTGPLHIPMGKCSFNWITQNDDELEIRVVIAYARQGGPPIKINRGVLACDATRACWPKHIVQRFIRDVAAGKQIVVIEKVQLFLDRQRDARMALEIII